MMFVEKTSVANKVEPVEIEGNIVDLENPAAKSHLLEKSREKPGGGTSSSNHQELTLSYMCENAGKEEGKGKRSFFENSGFKGKKIVSDAFSGQDQRWVERDFLQLGGGSANQVAGKLGLSVGGADGDVVGEYREKRQKVENLNLSLDSPNLSLSLNSSNPISLPKPAAAVAELPSATAMRRTQSNSTFNTQASSGDFSMSHPLSCSHPFSHNPSCSLTRNSTENYECSDQIWHAVGEGTNGSVHSRFKPIGDGNNSVTFSHHNGHPRLLANSNSMEISNGFRRINSFDSGSFFPSELPARHKKEQGKTNSDGPRSSLLTNPEKMLRDIILESIHVVAQMLQEFPSESVEATKDYLRTLMTEAHKREEFISLQKHVDMRSDLTFEMLLKSHRAHLEILVAVKTGVENFLSPKNHLPSKELVEIFFLLRCKNVNCKNILPVDDCDCKICSSKKGFCNQCMCPLCMKFDCAQNTCSWVGCDVCSHWCHAMCGIQKNLIRPGPSLNGSAGTTEMQFHCIGCDHASEMFGFVKDVFVCCAKDWGLETLKKELDCVRKIFRGSEDSKGKEIQRKADEMLVTLDKNLISPMAACDIMLQFLKYGGTDFSNIGNASKDAIVASPLSVIPPTDGGTDFSNIGNASKDAIVASPLSVIPPKPMLGKVEFSDTSRDSHRATPKLSFKHFDPIPTTSLPKSDGFESLESMVQFKQEEASLYQRLADEARREVEAYNQIAQTKTEKLEEEYSDNLAKLCLQETEERKRRKVEELKLLENMHYDYYKMKTRMESEMATLLERMEATKQLWA